MKKTYSKIINKLEKELESVNSNSEETIIKAELSLKLIKQKLKELKDLVSPKKFKTPVEEIQFFKISKPAILAKLFFFDKQISILSKRPKGSAKIQKEYLNIEINKLQAFFNDNLEFYKYFKTGKTYLDHHYFLRGEQDFKYIPNNFYCLLDDDFSTIHDTTVATILAFEMLIGYLLQEIEKINNGKSISQINQLNSSLFWTGNKVDLVELIYALQSSGVINKGSADIKEVASVFEKIFNIELGDYYRTFLEIRFRKINNTKFVDLLKDNLVKRIEESDE